MGSDFVAIKDHGAAKQEPDLDTRERLVRAAIEVFRVDQRRDGVAAWRKARAHSGTSAGPR